MNQEIRVFTESFRKYTYFLVSQIPCNISILLNLALIILQSECIFFEPKLKTSSRPTEIILYDKAYNTILMYETLFSSLYHNNIIEFSVIILQSECIYYEPKLKTSSKPTDI